MVKIQTNIGELLTYDSKGTFYHNDNANWNEAIYKAIKCSYVSQDFEIHTVRLVENSKDFVICTTWFYAILQLEKQCRKFVLCSRLCTLC